MAEKTALAPDTPVKTASAWKCCASVGKEPGKNRDCFSLTVPTGDGKTLSSLAVALEHAVMHDKHRVIYAIPHTSIVEQTTDLFRSIFGEAVIEHHSNFDPERETAKTRLATENWDTAIVVTTNVQPFEPYSQPAPPGARNSTTW